MTEGRTGGGGAAASSDGVLVGCGGGDDDEGGELGHEVGAGTFEVDVVEGMALGDAGGVLLVAHWPAQNAVSWCSQKHCSAQVEQLAQAGVLVQPAV